MCFLVFICQAFTSLDVYQWPCWHSLISQQHHILCSSRHQKSKNRNRHFHRSTKIIQPWPWGINSLYHKHLLKEQKRSSMLQFYTVTREGGQRTSILTNFVPSLSYFIKLCMLLGLHILMLKSEKKIKKWYAKKSFKPGTVKCNTQIKQQQFHSARQTMWCYTNLPVLCHLSMLHFYHLLCLTADPEIHSVCKFFLKKSLTTEILWCLS